MKYKVSGAIAIPKASWGCAPALPNRIEVVSLREVALRKTTCVWFGRIALLSASVLFAGGYVVRIVYESFLDFGFSEFFMLLEWRTAFSHIPLRFQYHLIKTSVKGDSLSPF